VERLSVVGTKRAEAQPVSHDLSSQLTLLWRSVVQSPKSGCAAGGDFARRAAAVCGTRRLCTIAP
jgi:hypothetical protein